MTYNPDLNHLRALRSAMDLRSRTTRAIRAFFHDRDFLEVETPIRIPTPALEQHIDAEPADGYFLRTSPEFHMKRLLAADYKRIFQMGPCFRKGERGDLHNPEYTMLEWYRANANYIDILADTKMLIEKLVADVLASPTITYQGHEITLAPHWERMTVSEAFKQYAGWDPVEAFDQDRFDIDMVNRVEPGLPREVPVILTDYPAEAAAFARCKPGDPRVAERWELYVGGVEIANAYSELTDPEEQRVRFDAIRAAREADGRASYELDEPFLAAIASGIPDSGGIALGVDRLIMLLADAASLDEVLPFRE